jgi:signal transduction histidine kinase
MLAALRANGEEFPIDASISHHREAGHTLYTVILRDVTERDRAQEALRVSKQELQELATAAHAAREHEQSRFARELHDELGQALTALKMSVAWIDQRAGKSDLELKAKLERMSTLIDNTLQATRRISTALRPLILDDLGLVPALESIVEGFIERTGVRCDFTTTGELDLEDAQKSAVFRIVQEALTNIARHAHASLVDVRITRGADAIAIDIKDNGVGFAMPEERSRTSRGILGMRERAYLLGGTFVVTSSPGNGTRLAVRIPIGDTVSAA